MTTKTLTLGVAGIVVLAVGAYLTVSPIAKRALEGGDITTYTATGNEVSVIPQVDETAMPSEPVESETPDAATVEVTTPSDTPAADTPTTPTPTSKPTTPTAVPTPTPTPTPEPTPTPKPSGYTLADVATHAGASSCWTAINGSVYDLTSYVSRHPGGERNILKICGKDGTSLFEGQHGGESRPESTLAKMRIGALI